MDELMSSNKKSKVFLLKLIILISISIAQSGCLPTKSKVVVNLKKNAVKEPLSITVSNIKVVNNQIIITGTNLNSVSNFKIKEGAIQTALQIESKTNTSLVANTISNVTFAVGKVFDFILSNAHAASTFTVDFSLCDASLGGKNIACLVTPTDKQVLSYDGNSHTWRPRSVNGLSYKGVWSSLPALPAAGALVPGDYFIVSVANGAYSVGDWIVLNDDGVTFEQIENSVQVKTVFGRNADVVAAENDYQLDLLGDVDLSAAPMLGDALIYNGSKWIAGPVSGGGGGAPTGAAAGDLAGTYPNPTIGSNKITDTHIANGAISQTKINGLATSLSGKEPAITAAATTTYFRGDKTFATLNTSVVPEGSNLYFTNARALGILLAGFDNSLTGQVSAGDSVLQGFGRLQNQINSLGSSGSNYLVKNGADTISGTVSVTNVITATGAGDIVVNSVPLTMTSAVNKTYADGKLDKTTGGVVAGVVTLDNDLKIKSGSNYVTIKGNAATAGDYNFVLPASAGTAGYFLSTDGSGNTSWVSAGGGGAPTGAATGDLGGSYPAPSVATVGGVTAANVAAGANLANAATNANTANTIVKRDGSGNFTATNVSGTVAVANGGTGKTTLGLNNLLFGNTTSPIGEVAATATPSVLLSADTTGLPTWTTSTTGNVLKGSVAGVAFGPLALGDLPTGTLSGLGTINYIPYYSATNTLASSPVAVSGTNVGIGTASPTAKLEVVGDTPMLLIRDTISGGDSEAGFFIEGDGSTGGLSAFSDGFTNIPGWADALVLYSDNVSSGGLRLHANGGNITFGNGWSPNVDRMVILPSGNVGIGTPTPGAPLDVKGAIRMSGATSGYVGFTVPAAAGSTTYTWPSSAPATNQILQSDNTGALSWVSVGGTGDALVANPLSQFAATTSPQLAGVLSDESGTGAAIFAGSPTFTGVPLAPTAAVNTNTTQLATTAFVVGQASSAGPLMNGTQTVGTSLQYARGDHIHPTDTSRAPVEGSASITTVGTITAGVWNGTTIAVANGGTGKTTLGLNNLLFGNTTSPIGEVASTATPSVLLSTVATGLPTWTTSTAGNVLKGSVTGVAFGPLDLSDLPAGTLSGAGTVNYVPYYNTTTTLANSPVAISGSNVGIGTAAPDASLHIVGASGTTLKLVDGNQATGKMLVSDANGVASWQNLSIDSFPNFFMLNKVRVATGGDIVLSGLQTIDNVAVNDGDRVLVKKQTNAQDNGIYIASTGAWTRASDMSTWNSTIGYKTFVLEGQSNQGSEYVSNTALGGTLGTTSITFGAIAASNAITALGRSALGSNTTGLYNTALGYGVLSANTTSSFNTAIGYGALNKNISGSGANVAIGVSTMSMNTTGFYNTALGTNSLQYNDTGYRNTAIGYLASRNATTGNYNTSLGYSALRYNLIGSRMTAIGESALENAKGNSNIGLGSYAGSAIQTGDYNVVIGSNNGSSIDGLSNHIIIADGQGNARIRVDNLGNVGIGTTTPGAPLDVKGAIRMSGATSGYTGFQPAAVAGSTVWTLPTADGSSGQILRTDGAGVLSWVNDNSGAGAFTGAASSAVTTDGAGALTTSATTSTELGYVSGVTSSIQTQLNAKEPTITAGTSAQYLKGDKTLGTFLTDVMNSLLTGISFGTNSAITAADNLLVALGKLQAQITSLASNGQWTQTGNNVYRTIGSVGIGTSSPTATLTVQGAAVSRTNIIATGATVDLALANNHLLKAPGGSSITLQNPVDGGVYTMVVTDTTSRTYTFSGCTNSYFSPVNGPTTDRSTYTVMVVVDGANTECFITWITSFN